MKIIDEKQVPEKVVPGRFLRWIVEPDGNEGALASRLCSSCVMRVSPGQTVLPAHAHPDGEELIYVMEGNGKVYVDGQIRRIYKGCAVLFEKGSIHMVRNSGLEEMKVVCFYSPATNLKEYEYHPEVDFDTGVES